MLAVTRGIWRESGKPSAIAFSEPPYTGQLTQPSAVKLCEAKLAELSSRLTPETSQAARKTYEEALALRPDDPTLHQNFAAFLEATGDIARATVEARQVEELLPQVPVTPYFIGLMLVRQCKPGEAAESFGHALTLDSHYVPALNGLGEVFANEQRDAEARDCFDRALKLNPNNAETYLNLGFMEQSGGRSSNALTFYQTAARFGNRRERRLISMKPAPWPRSIGAMNPSNSSARPSGSIPGCGRPAICSASNWRQRAKWKRHNASSRRPSVAARIARGLIPTWELPWPNKANRNWPSLNLSPPCSSIRLTNPLNRILKTCKPSSLS